MYSALMLDAMEKIHEAMYGGPIEVMVTDQIRDSKRFMCCSYVSFSDPAQCRDPEVANVMRKHPGKLDYFVLFDNALTSTVSGAISRRRNTRPVSVVWSVCIKLMWEKLRILHRTAHPEGRFQDEVLSPKEIVGCLPVGYERSWDVSVMELVYIIKTIYDKELVGFKLEFDFTPADQERGIPELMAEASTIPMLALKCNGERQLLQFLKACAETVRKKPQRVPRNHIQATKTPT